MRRSRRWHAAVLAPASIRATDFAREYEIDHLRWRSWSNSGTVSDEGNDPVRHGSRHRFPGKRCSDLWHKLARPGMPLPGTVLSPGMARHGSRALGCGLRRLETTQEPSLAARYQGGQSMCEIGVQHGSGPWRARSSGWRTKRVERSL